MDRIDKLSRSAVGTAAALLLLASPASAQLHDHLKCYKVKDPSSASATVDLRPADLSNFEVDAGCTVKVRSRQVCFPVEKDLVNTTGTSLDVNGPELATPYLCYKVRCPAAAIPASLQMSDQFGTRTLTSLRTSTVCAPAVLGVPPVTTTTTNTVPSGTPRNCVDATAPNCDGTCNDFNNSCEEQSGACVCVYYDVFAPCPRAGHGTPECWGTCSGSLSCLDVGGGACQCGLAVE
jgi:hypothetical protein